MFSFLIQYDTPIGILHWIIQRHPITPLIKDEHTSAVVTVWENLGEEMSSAPKQLNSLLEHAIEYRLGHPSKHNKYEK